MNCRMAAGPAAAETVEVKPEELRHGPRPGGGRRSGERASPAAFCRPVCDPATQSLRLAKPRAQLESIDSDPSPSPAKQASGLVVEVCMVITDSLSLGARREEFGGGPARTAAAPSRRDQFEAEACAAALLPCT